MSVGYTVLALLAFVVLTLGTAVFVAAEVSLTALERRCRPPDGPRTGISTG